MDKDDDILAALSPLGWQMIEVVERMLDHKFPMTDICDAWDCAPEHINYMLARAAAERHHLLWDINGKLPE